MNANQDKAIAVLTLSDAKEVEENAKQSPRAQGGKVQEIRAPSPTLRTILDTYYVRHPLI